MNSDSDTQKRSAIAGTKVWLLIGLLGFAGGLLFYIFGTISGTRPPSEDARIRAIVNKLMIADQPAANAPVYTYPPIKIPGQPAPEVDPNDPRLAAYEAEKTLGDLGVKAWPYLMERLDDPRQSIAMASEYPCTVARACFHLIAYQVNPPGPGGYFHSYDLLRNGDDIRGWWAERKGRELRDLKIEAARYAWVLAELDGEHVEHYAGALGNLGLKKPEEGAAPWRALAATLSTPDEPDALVPILAAPKAGDFLARRFASERARRASVKLYDQELAAFPALVKGLEDPEVARWCFRIVGAVLHTYHMSEQEELAIFITPAQAAAWWPSRKGSNLKELRLEAARYLQSGIQKKTFANPGDKINLQRFIAEQIRRIEMEP